jgi:hypothetical protein
MKWELKGHSHQIADTGDYDGYYEITNGKISLLTKDDDDEALQPVVDALNNSGCKFYQDDWIEFENKMLKEEISRLKFMINNGLGFYKEDNTMAQCNFFEPSSNTSSATKCKWCGMEKYFHVPIEELQVLFNRIKKSIEQTKIK